MAEKKGKEAASKPVEELVMMQAGAQENEATPLVIMQLKVWPGKPNPKEVWEEAVIGESPYLATDKFS